MSDQMLNLGRLHIINRFWLFRIILRQTHMWDLGMLHIIYRFWLLRIIQFNSIQKNFIWNNNYCTHKSASTNLRLIAIYKKKQITRATYYLHTPWGCTAPFRECKKIPPPTSSVPLSPTFFLAFSLKQKERDISLEYTKVSIIGYFIAHGKKWTQSYILTQPNPKTTLHIRSIQLNSKQK